MAKKKGITVVLTDGRKFEIDVANPKPADLVAVEAKFDISSDAMGGPNARTAWVMFIVWRYCRRADPQIMETSFEDFLELVDDLIENEGIEAADPTKLEQPTA